MGVCEEESLGCSPGDEQLILKRCHSCGLPQLYETLEGWESVCDRAYNLKGIKRKFSVFLLFLKFCFFYYSSFYGMMHTEPVVVGRSDVK